MYIVKTKTIVIDYLFDILHHWRRK